MPAVGAHRGSPFIGGAVALAGLAMAFVLWGLGRDTTFFFDEWDFVLRRRTGATDAFLRPHNGHLSVVPVALYRVLFATVGLDGYGAYRALGIGSHLLCVVLLYVYARRRVGPPVAALAALALLLHGRSWQNLLWPFQVGYFASLAAGLGALLLLDRDDRRADGWAAACLGLSLASSGLGIPVTVGVAVELAWRRRTWRRLWVVAAPSAAYAVWYLAYGESQARLSNAAAVPGYVRSAAAAAVGALVGTGPDWGGVLALVVVGLIGARVVAIRRFPARLAMALASCGVFWVLTALSRAELAEPGASRYLYPAAVFLLIAGLEAVDGIRVRPLALTAGGVAVALAAWSNADVLRAGAGGLRATSSVVAAELASLEAAGDGVDPRLRPDPARMPQVEAGPYLAAVEDLGSPALPVRRLGESPEDVRQAADAVAAQALGAGLGPAGAGSGTEKLTVEAASGRATPTGPCVTVEPLAHVAALDIELPGAGVLVRAGPAPVAVRIRRLASGFLPVPLATVASGSTAALRIPADRIGRTWHVRLEAAGPLTACPAAPPP